MSAVKPVCEHGFGCCYYHTAEVHMRNQECKYRNCKNNLPSQLYETCQQHCNEFTHAKIVRCGYVAKNVTTDGRHADVICREIAVDGRELCTYHCNDSAAIDYINNRRTYSPRADNGGRFDGGRFDKNERGNKKPVKKRDQGTKYDNRRRYPDEN